MSNSNRLGSCALKLFKWGSLLLVLTAVASFVFLEEWVASHGKKKKKSGDYEMREFALPEGDVDMAQLKAFEQGLNKEEGILADGTTRVQQTVLWQIIGNQIYYRIILQPYDEEANRLMKSPQEALFISFVAKDGRLLAPKSSAMRIETSKLRVASKDGKPSAWFIDGKLPIATADRESVHKAVVGWFFTSRLHARLRDLWRAG